MTTINKKNLSALAQSALDLEDDISDLERLSGQIDELNIESESGMNQARNLLGKFGERGAKIAEAVQNLAKSLDEGRRRAEKAAEVVATKAVLVQKRQEETDRIFQKFKSLVENVHDITSKVATLKKPEGEELTAEEKSSLPRYMADLDARLAEISDQMVQLKNDARNANMKNLERDADALAQSMSAARRKLSVFVTPPTVPMSSTLN